MKLSKIPLILGEIPELLPGRQPGRAFLNNQIKKACQEYTQCHVMPFDKLHKQVMKDGYLTMYGKKQTIAQIVPDGLHLSPTAGEFLADEMLALIKN